MFWTTTNASDTGVNINSIFEYTPRATTACGDFLALSQFVEFKMFVYKNCDTVVIERGQHSLNI